MSNSNNRIRNIAAIIVMFLLLAAVAQAQETLTATTNVNLNVRERPAPNATRVTTLPAGSSMIVQGRNEAGDWLLIQTEDGSVRGWVAIGFLQFSRPVRVNEEVPLVQETNASGTQTQTQQTEQQTQQTQRSSATSSTPRGQRLTAFVEDNSGPSVVLNANVMRNVRTIFARGRQRGMQPNSMMKIGDSNIAGHNFLCNLQYPGHYDLGEFDYLENVRASFAETNSFCRASVSAQYNFNSASVLDSTFSLRDLCEPNESPLQCDVRRLQPSFAFIYIGIQDAIGNSDVEELPYWEFRENLTQIVRELSAAGVVPVLMTFATDQRLNEMGLPQIYNTVIREVARTQRVPLIDMRAAVFNYENHGASSDGGHLSHNQLDFTSFAGDQHSFGLTLRDLFALQVIHEVLGNVG